MISINLLLIFLLCCFINSIISFKFLSLRSSFLLTSNGDSISIRTSTNTNTNSRSSISSSKLNANTLITNYKEISIPTSTGISVIDITSHIQQILQESSCQEGIVTICSKHSTVAISINEMESRLVDDIRQYFLKLVPPEYPYLHNDLEFRLGPNDWPGGDKAWRIFRSTQPPNAHAHLIAMLLGTTETIPIHQGQLQIGKYQNILVIDSDGPKTRTIGIQITGSTDISN